MSEADETAGATTGPASSDRVWAEYRNEIGGNAEGPVIAGDYNMVIDAQHGSTVNLLTERERPRPVRRDRIELLPGRQRQPVGRDAEIAMLSEAVRAGGPVQLCGPPGIGKSALLRHAARLLDPGPDGVIFLTATHREVEDLAQEVFECCYETAGYAPSRAELRRLMAGVRVTVYMDNADFETEQLLELKDMAPDATFVLAGTERALGSEGTVVELSGLDLAAGLDLLASELHRPLLKSERAAATDLWQAAGGRPLILVRAAGLARFDSAGAARLPRPGEVPALLPLLFDQLDPAELDVLHLLATLFDAELDPVHIGALTEAPDAAGMCGRLADLGLLVPAEHGYRLAADAGPVLRERHPEPFPVERLCEYFIQWATQKTTTSAAVSGQSRALEQAAVLAESVDRPDLAVQVTRAASPAMARSLRFGGWGRLLGRGWVAAGRAGDRHAAAYFVHEEGIRALLTGKRVLAAALLAEALVLWRELGDGHGVNTALHAQRYTPPAHTATAHGGAAAGHPAAHGMTPHLATTHMAALGHGTTAAATHAAGYAIGTASGVTTGAAGATTAGTVGGTGGATTASTTGAASPQPTRPSPSAQPRPPARPTSPPQGAHAGATVTAGAAKGGSAGLLGLAVAGAAVVIGAVAVAHNLGDNPGSDPSSLSTISSAAPEPPGPVSAGPTDAGTPSDAPANTDLAGMWRDDQTGGTLEFVASGDGSYTAEATNSCGNPANITVTGGDGSYSGTTPLYQDLCAQAIGYISITINIDTDGTTAVMDSETAPGQPECDSGCGTTTLTREQ